MRLVVRCFYLFLSYLLLSLTANAQTDTLGLAREVRIRKGLPNFMQKLQSGQPVTIAYFGGSITEAGGGYREQVTAWLQTQYPQAKITGINAGIGGTGSDLGAFRVGQQVLAHYPDLVLVEFAVNDNGKTSTSIHEAMEGIVRQTWRNNHQTDICFVYTLMESMFATLQDGKLPNSARAMEDIAQHYGIPSVHLGLEVVRKATAGTLVFKGKKEEYPDKLVFSGDNVHPYPETGHLLYTEAFGRAFTRMAKAIEPQKTAHQLKTPFTPDNWEDATMVSVQELKKQGEWTELKPENSDIKRLMPRPFPCLLKSTQPGASLTANIVGQAVGLYDVVGPGTGQFMLVIDGQKTESFTRFDKYATYYRPHYFVHPGLKPGRHTVEFKVSEVVLDKKAILLDNPEYDKNPERFSESAAYAGYLLVRGKIIK